MPGPLKNARHEKFAQELAKGQSQVDAYAAAGFAANRACASRLQTKANIQARVEELKLITAEKVTEKAAIDAAWVLKRASELHDKALEAKAFTAAKGALELIGKHVDVQAFRDQIRHSGLIEYRDLSDEEIDARIAAREAEDAGSHPTAH